MTAARTWRSRAGLVALTALLVVGCSSNDVTASHPAPGGTPGASTPAAATQMAAHGIEGSIGDVPWYTASLRAAPRFGETEKQPTKQAQRETHRKFGSLCWPARCLWSSMTMMMKGMRVSVRPTILIAEEARARGGRRARGAAADRRNYSD